jgi:hypothetical protein
VLDRGQCVVRAVGHGVEAGDLQLMAHASLDGQGPDVDARREVECQLHVAELDRHRDVMDGDVRRAERRPGMVAVPAETAAYLPCPGEEAPRLQSVVRAGGGHGADQVEAAQ